MFPDTNGAQARKAYIVETMAANPAYTEYDYVTGGVLIRVSRLVTADQVDMYEQALAEFGGGPTDGIDSSPAAVPPAGSAGAAGMGTAAEITDLY
ncbi:hypothetical protein Ga0074812_10297 [Parafrankia irregularis]|uniref:Uncharacterized protein n=1 Tax=Parafrankia irregularis TaxID=795642 RepID=A0A0S4QFN6_9ACTN|nr:MULTISPECIES: hypothetical protein [Parafrankia]MBE3203257.1 hypothetical protein [Parafrankia sp. CH37]CUU54094.1 hypothetical protein Ga0074812_10297 [Parafrankia irregularis]